MLSVTDLIYTLSSVKEKIINKKKEKDFILPPAYSYIIFNINNIIVEEEE